jgi:hypothetical protein
MLKQKRAELGILAASSRFGRYKPEKEELARLPEVSGNELEQLRRKRELLLSMSPEQAFSVIEFHDRLNVFEALALAKKEGKLIVPNLVHDRILSGTKEEYSVWAGTIVIYEAPGKPFGEQITNYGISFTIPKIYRGLADCALVAEHPDFDIVPLKNKRYRLRIPDEKLALLEDFPTSSHNAYHCDERFGIPINRPKNGNESLRTLFRELRASVGLVICDYLDSLHDNCRDVIIQNTLSNAFGVALF